MIKYIAVVIALFAIASSIFISGMRYESYKTDSRVNAQVIAITQQKDEFAKTLQNHTADTLQRINILWETNSEIYGKVEREIIREKIYEECIVPEAGKDLIRAARGAK